MVVYFTYGQKHSKVQTVSWGLRPAKLAVVRRLIKMALQELQFLEQQIGQLDQEIANSGTLSAPASSERRD
jgi:hypothetical protein